MRLWKNERNAMNSFMETLISPTILVLPYKEDHYT